MPQISNLQVLKLFVDTVCQLDQKLMRKFQIVLRLEGREKLRSGTRPTKLILFCSLQLKLDNNRAPLSHVISIIRFKKNIA